MKEATLFIPMNEWAICQFFGAGIIVPTKYQNINRGFDIQSMLPNSIILTTEKWIKGSEVSVEVKAPQNLQDMGHGIMIASVPIPTTEIVGIWFRKKKIMSYHKFLLTSGCNSQYFGSKIPDNKKQVSRFNLTKTGVKESDKLQNNKLTAKFKVDKQSQHDEVNLAYVDIDYSKISYCDLTEEVNNFNKLLGGLAVARAFWRHDTYLLSLSKLLPMVGSSVAEFVGASSLQEEAKYLIGLAGKSTGLGCVTASDVVSIAMHEGVKLTKKFGTFSMKCIPTNSWTMVFYLLHTNHSFHSVKLERMAKVMHRQYDVGFFEYTMFVYGLFVGYRKLRDEISVEGETVELKFNYESDYPLINKVYELAFNKVTSTP